MRISFSTFPPAQPGKYLELVGPTPDFDTETAIALAELMDWKVAFIRHQNAITTIVFEHKDGDYGVQCRQQVHAYQKMAQA